MKMIDPFKKELQDLTVIKFTQLKLGGGPELRLWETLKHVTIHHCH